MTPSVPFSHVDMGHGILRIQSTGTVFCYLVMGTEKAALIDGLSGLGDLRGYAETLTDKPILPLFTHGHVDHIGALYQFDRAWLHPNDWYMLETNGTREARWGFEKTSVPPETPFPYTVEDFTTPRQIELLPLSDGQVFDLGGRTLTAIELPGHTTGSTCFLDSETGILFSGDAGNDATFLFLPDSLSAAGYRQALVRVKETWADQFRGWYMFHRQSEAPLTILDDLIAGCDAILAGKETGEDTTFFIAGQKLPARFLHPLGENPPFGNIVFDPGRRA